MSGLSTSLKPTAIPNRYRRGLLLFALMLFARTAPGFGQTDSIPFSGTIPEQTLHGFVRLGSSYRSTDRIGAYGAGGESDGLLFLQADLPFGTIPLDIAMSSREDVYGSDHVRAGIHPELFNGALKLHAGDFYTDSPELTLAQTSIFGGGIEAQLGILRSSFYCGTVERPLTRNNASEENGSGRFGMEMGIGLGNDRSGLFDLRFARILDDTTSPSAEENSSASASFVLPVFDNGLRISGEAALAAWSSDIRASTLDVSGNFTEALFTPRTSSQLDGAALLRIDVVPSQSVSFGLDGRWIGPGYVTLAQPYLRNDLFQTSFRSALSLFNGGFYGGGSFGIAWDNLRDTKEGTTTELNGTFFGSVQPAPWIAVNLSYNDFGSSSDHANDTVRYGYLSRSASIAPSFFWSGLGGSNTGTLSASFRQGKIRITDGGFSRTVVRGLDATWSLALPSSLLFATYFGYSGTESETFPSTLFSINQSVSGAVLRGKLRGTGSLGISRYSGAEFASTAVDVNLTVSYDAAGIGRFSLSLANSYDEGFGSNALPTRELYGSLQYDMSF